MNYRNGSMLNCYFPSTGFFAAIALFNETLLPFQPWIVKASFLLFATNLFLIDWAFFLFSSCDCIIQKIIIWRILIAFTSRVSSSCQSWLFSLRGGQNWTRLFLFNFYSSGRMRRKNLIAVSRNSCFFNCRALSSCQYFLFRMSIFFVLTFGSGCFWSFIDMGSDGMIC